MECCYGSTAAVTTYTISVRKRTYFVVSLWQLIYNQSWGQHFQDYVSYSNAGRLEIIRKWVWAHQLHQNRFSSLTHINHLSLCVAGFQLSSYKVLTRATCGGAFASNLLDNDAVSQVAPVLLLPSHLVSCSDIVQNRLHPCRNKHNRTHYGQRIRNRPRKD